MRSPYLRKQFCRNRRESYSEVSKPGMQPQRIRYLKQVENEDGWPIEVRQDLENYEEPQPSTETIYRHFFTAHYITIAHMRAIVTDFIDQNISVRH